MTRFFQTLMLILTLGLTMPLHAADTPSIPDHTPPQVQPPPLPSLAPDDMMVLGSIQLPAEVVKKLDAEQITSIIEHQVSVPKSLSEHIFNESTFVPTIVFSAITAISFFVIYYSFRKRREMMDTVRTAIQSGQTLPPSVLEALESKRQPTPDGDLRKAVLLIAIGVSGTIVLAALGEKEAGRAWSVGFVPTLLGIGYLYLWRQSQKKAKAGLSDDQR